MATLFLVCVAAAPAAFAQQQQELTADLVNQRIAVLQADGASDEAVEAAYEQVRALLNQASANEEAADSYTRALTTAPEQQAVIQSRLDSMEDTYDPANELVGLTPADLNARLAIARTQLDELTIQQEATDRRLDARDASTASLEARLTEIDQLISTLPTTNPTVDPMGQPSAEEADRWRDLAQARNLASERRALQARLASQPVRYSVMATARAETAVNLERMEAMVGFLESNVTSSGDAIADPIELGFDPGDPAFQIAEDLTKELSALQGQWIDLNSRLQLVRQQNERIDDVSEMIDERHGTAERIVKFAEGSQALGQVLLTYWEELQDFSLADPTKNVPQLAGDLVIERLKHEETLAELIRASAYLSSRMRDAGIDPDTVPEGTSQDLLTLVKSYREQLSDIISVQSEYLEAITRLDTGYKVFQAKLADYRAYLESMLLWIPNRPPLWTLNKAMIPANIAYAESRFELTRYTPDLGSGGLVLVALGLFLIRRRLQAQQQVLNDRTAKPRADSIRHTLASLGLVALRAAPAPLLMLAFALGFDSSASAETAAMHKLFIRFAVLLFGFRLMRIVCEGGGLALVHFHWPATVAERVSSEMTFLIRWWLPLVISAAIAHHFSPPSGDEAAGRLLLLASLLIAGYHIVAPQIRQMRENRRGWFKQHHYRWRTILTAVVLLNLYGVVVGQIFSVLVIFNVLINSFLIGVAILLVNSVLVRWLRVARRHLRLSEALAQRQEQTEDEGMSVEETVPDLVDISTETQQLITFATILVSAIAFLYVWSPLLPALEGLSRITLWTSSSVIDGVTVANSITVETLLTVMALAAFTLFAAKRLPALVEIVLRSRTNVTPGARYTISTMLNYVIVGGGIVAGLSALGLQWSQLQWLVAALGVGIGFGLQEIVANFISGLIILFERPIRVGDIVTVGDKDGAVIKIRIRATTIRDWDGKELLVPNKEFITGRLLNWTLTDSHTRLVLPVGIAYGSKVEEALNILDEVVRKNPRVMDSPEPSVLFTGFGDNSLNLVARCYTSRVEDRMPVISELHTAINRAFEDAGIEISFPQRDIHFDSDKPLRIALDGPHPSNS